ncbi:MAG TPA: CotH kinase family protein, partial [Candidatus Limnocylindria bacterium]|nr:CotH kinase family protein [Candidatus Limnocylindria bacterium]
RVRTALTAALTIGQPFTIKGSVRWLRGWPETILRVKGGHMEAYVRMEVPLNLGTPGARNSIAKTNSAPAIYAVVHSPVLPQTGDNIVITAGAQDPDGVANVTLYYRVDSASPPAFTALAMNDNGTAGDAVAKDGIYSGMIPAQSSGTMISFYVEATDTKAATSQFPVGAIATTLDGQRRECLVRWGDPIPVSAFATYRLWMSRANVNSYINRPALSNQDIDSTMVVGNTRVIYNMYSHYSNSPYHQGQNGSPETGGQHFDIHLPLDDKYLGTENFNKVHAPGNASFEDNNWIREQTAYWVARKVGMPYLHRRFVAMYVNGARKAGGNAGATALMEDTQRPGGELIAEFFPDETEGRLYKLQPWFEFDDVIVTGGGAAAFDNKLWCTLTRNLSTNAHKIARYRQNYLSRSADATANDYTNVIALIEAANVPQSNPAYWRNLSGLIDVDQWAHIFAVEHAVGNWDSFGGVNAQNMYGYKPNGGKWKLMIWDLNIVLNNASGNSDGAGPGTTSNPPGGNLFDVQSGQDPLMAAMEAYPPFRRAWWRAYKELTVGPNAPMLAANCDPLIDAKNDAFRASGLTPGAVAAGNPNSVKGFLRVAQSTIAAAVAANDFGNRFSLATASVTASVSNLVTISGNAAFDATEIEINGVSWPVTWTTITSWTALVPVTNGAPITVAAYDKAHNSVGSPGTVTVNYSIAAPLPDPRNFIVFNEVMYNPAPNAPGGEYIELYNMHTNFAFNIGGWRINGLDYTFPPGTYFPPRSFLVLAKDRVAFNIAYGATVAVFDQFSGSLQGGGETLTLIQSAASVNGTDVVIDRLRYENTAPWSTNADNSGSSLQLLDPGQDNSRVGNWASAFVP